MAKLMIDTYRHKKLDVQGNVSILEPEDLPHSFGGKFPVIVYSHGLASARVTSNYFLKEFASRGVIIVSVQTDDHILTPAGVINDFPVRREGLLKRYSAVEAALEFILNEEQVKSLFGQHSVRINKDSISIAGHSYGGATAAYTAVHNMYITGVCMCLDAWMYPLEREDFSRTRVPIIMMRSVFLEKTTPGNN